MRPPALPSRPAARPGPTAAGLVVIVLPLLLAVLLDATRPAVVPEATVAGVVRALDRVGVPGAAVVVVRGHDVQIETTGDIGPRTPMPVASLTKAFTATAVLRLVDSGRIRLDDRAVDRIPELAAGDPRLRDVTVRQLLSHSSGRTDATLGFDQYEVRPRDAREAVHLLRHSRSAYPPGSDWDYCNVNYWVLERLVEVVTGEPYPSFLHREVLIPLGLRDTRVVATPGHDPASDRTHSLALGRPVHLAGPGSWSAGAGDLVTTPADLGRWLVVQQGAAEDRVYRTVVSRRLLAEAHRAQTPSAGRFIGYGFGWWSGEPASGGMRRVSHSGVGAGHGAYAGLFPDGIGIGVLVGSTAPRADDVAAAARTVLDGRQPPPVRPAVVWPDVAALGLTTAVLLVAASGVWRAQRGAGLRRGGVLLPLVGAGLVVSVPSFLERAVGRQAPWSVLWHVAPVPTACAAVCTGALLGLAMVRLCAALALPREVRPGRGSLRDRR